MNIQQKNSAHHFRMQSEREQTLAIIHRSSDSYIQFLQRKFWNKIFYIAFNWSIHGDPIIFNTNIISSKQNHTHI